MIREHSLPRLYWDALVAILVIITCLLIPYQLAFVHQPRMHWLIYLIDLVFLVDIGLNFITSYRERGAEVRDTRRTARRYARTLLPVDLLANIPFDLLVLLLAGDAQMLGASLVLWLRLLSLLRVIRLVAILRRWQAMLWTNPGVLKVAGFVIMIALFTHWVACMWFFTAFAAGFPPDSWAVRAGIDNADAAGQYVRSLYWTITTITTVGFGDITPGRTVEYLVAMVLMLIGASLFVFIVGSIASLLNTLHANRNAYRERAESVGDYLRARQVPAELFNKVRHFFDYRWDRFGGLEETALLSDLPEPLRLEIILHLARDVIEKVPLFRYCSTALRNALLVSLQPQTYPPDSVVAREGERGRCIFFVTAGSVEIFSQTQETRFGLLEAGDYFGHLSLVLDEPRTASVRATDYCEMLLLHKQDYERLNAEFPEFRAALGKTADSSTEKMSELVLGGVVL